MDIPVGVKIKKIRKETPFVRTFVFEHPLGAKPGQFVNLWIPGVDEKPFSVSYDDGKVFWLTIASVGPFTRALFELRAGDKVGIRGPYGKGFEFQSGQKLVLVAGGYGAAPLFFAAGEASKKKCKVDFIAGARTEVQLLFIKQILELKNINLHITTDDGSAGRKGRCTEVLLELARGRKNRGKIDWIFACGPELMLKKVSDIAHEHKIRTQISLERYMKCGIGLCGQCCVDGLGIRICQEGPVLKNDLLRKIPEFGKYHRNSVGKKLYFC